VGRPETAEMVAGERQAAGGVEGESGGARSTICNYRFIFDGRTSIAFFQLLANVAFAATVGALAANIPKSVFVWFRRCFLSKRAAVVYFIALIIGLAVWLSTQEQARLDEQKRQEARRAFEVREQARQQAEEANQSENPYVSRDPNYGLVKKLTVDDILGPPPAEQAKRDEIAKENVKRAATNQALAEKAFRENKPTLARDYWSAAASCWRFANRYDLAEECMAKANRIGWVTEP
jgi:hypothetical protein